MVVVESESLLICPRPIPEVRRILQALTEKVERVSVKPKIPLLLMIRLLSPVKRGSNQSGH
jgi:hypothetical protein